ncbi:unnamed protein product [Rangifer tarandus platyrhynchus]|uniref:Uncharacterized protein n=1 Tax=Rangifer tarandus platyrhynchus TaxID=3082113 RepID=A0AC59YRG6_RANTA
MEMAAAAFFRPGAGASHSRNLNANLLGETLAHGAPRLLGGEGARPAWRGAAGGKQGRGKPVGTYASGQAHLLPPCWAVAGSDAAGSPPLSSGTASFDGSNCPQACSTLGIASIQ